MSPGEAIFVPSPPKTGTSLRHPPPPQSLNGSGGGLIEVVPHTQFSRRFLLTVRIDLDINLLHSVLVLYILTVNGSMSFLNVMDLAVVARFYRIRGYSMTSVCIFAFQEALTTHGVMSESRSLAKFLRKN